jgi:predicted regulator of Ras-like GTPase activity (Roadblock/LC7/MglB family)
MLMELGQLVYTSFPGLGFKNLASDRIPASIQSFFLTEVVLKHWDSYDVKFEGEQAIYIHQPTLESCIFGWLYGEEVDEYSRSIPYFIGYYLSEPLNADNLSRILACLQRGPLSYWDRRQTTHPTISVVNIPSIQDHKAAKRGLDISAEICAPLYAALAKQEPINQVIFGARKVNGDRLTPMDQTPVTSDQVESDIPNQPSVSTPHQSLANQTDEISRILQGLMDKPLAIQGASLISAEGQLLTPLVGKMDTNSASILSGTMLYLSKRTCEELKWNTIEKVCIQSQDGYVILLQCSSEVFLLIQTGQILTGLLDGVINRTAQRIQATLHSNASNVMIFPEQAAAERNRRHLAAV